MQAARGTNDFEIARLVGLRDQIYREWEKVGIPQEDLIIRQMQDSVRWGNLASFELVAKAPGIDGDILRNQLMGKLDTSLALSLARGDVVSRFVYTGNPDGITLSDRIYTNINQDFTRMFNEITRRSLVGESAYKIAKSVVEFMRDENVFGYTPWKSAVRLTRTEMAEAFRAGQIEAYSQMPFVEAIEWELSLSHRTRCKCEQLARQDLYDMGKGVYPIDKVPPIPHPHCLCWLKPVIKENE